MARLIALAARLRVLVHQQVVLFVKSLAAVLALDVARAQVNVLVHFQATYLCESLIAFVAAVGLLACVGSEVHEEL